MKPILGHFYRMWGDTPTGFFFQVGVPTEHVLRAPGFTVPTMARIWAVDLYLDKGGALHTYDELRALPDFKGTAYYERIFRCEVFEDNGNDGHIDYGLVGYRFVPNSWFAPEPFSAAEAPPFMLNGYSDVDKDGAIVIDRNEVSP